MRKNRFLAACFLVFLTALLGCEFDPTGFTPDDPMGEPDEPGNAAPGDAAPDDGMPPTASCPTGDVIDLELTGSGTFELNSSTKGLISRHQPSCVPGTTEHPDEVYRMRVTSRLKIVAELQAEHWNGSLEFLKSTCGATTQDTGSPSCVQGNDTLQLDIAEELEPGQDYYLWVDGSSMRASDPVQSGTYRLTIQVPSTDERWPRPGR